MGPETQRMWQIAARYSTVGIEMAASVGFGTWGGWWLDQHFGTAPYLFWFGVVVGVVGDLENRCVTFLHRGEQSVDVPHL